MQTNETPKADVAPSERAIATLTRLGRRAAIVFVIAFQALLVVGFSGLLEGGFHIFVAIVFTVAIFGSGVACVGAFLTREIILWRHRKWRFSLASLFIVITQIALILGLLSFVTSN